MVGGPKLRPYYRLQYLPNKTATFVGFFKPVSSKLKMRSFVNHLPKHLRELTQRMLMVTEAQFKARGRITRWCDQIKLTRMLRFPDRVFLWGKFSSELTDQKIRAGTGPKFLSYEHVRADQ